MLSLKAFTIISETQQKSQETEIKLHVLMDAMTNQQSSGPRPIPLELMTSASQETMSAQGQLQWHQSSQGRNRLIFKAFQTIKIHNEFFFNILSFFLLFLDVSDSSGSRFAIVSRSDHVMYQQTMMAPPAAEIIQRADPIVSIRYLSK